MHGRVLRDRLGEDHHDIVLVNRDGQLLARRRIGNDAAGLLALPAEPGDTPDDLIPVAIETPRGCWLRACGHRLPATRST